MLLVSMMLRIAVSYFTPTQSLTWGFLEVRERCFDVTRATVGLPRHLTVPMCLYERYFS